MLLLQDTETDFQTYNPTYKSIEQIEENISGYIARGKRQQKIKFYYENDQGETCMDRVMERGNYKPALPPN